MTLIVTMIHRFIRQNNLENMGERYGFYVMMELPAFMSKFILDGNMLSLPKVTEPRQYFVNFNFVHNMTLV